MPNFPMQKNLGMLLTCQFSIYIYNRKNKIYKHYFTTRTTSPPFGAFNTIFNDLAGKFPKVADTYGPINVT